METFGVCISDTSECKPSKSEILRGVVTEKLTTAVQEILLVLDTTIAGYDKDVLSLKREVDLYKRQLNALGLKRPEGNCDETWRTADVFHEEAKEGSVCEVLSLVTRKQEEQCTQLIHNDEQEDECSSDYATQSGKDENDPSPAENHEDEHDEPNVASKATTTINTEAQNREANEISKPNQCNHLDDSEIQRQHSVKQCREEKCNNDTDALPEQDMRGCSSEDFSESLPATKECSGDESDLGNNGERIVRKRRPRRKRIVTNGDTEDGGEMDGEWTPEPRSYRRSSRVKRARINREAAKVVTGEHQESPGPVSTDGEAGEDGQSEDDQSKRRRTTLNCKVCGAPFNYKSILTKHVLHFHLQNPKALCGVCGRQQETPEQLKSHVEAHDKLHQCVKCTRYFGTPYFLQKHAKACMTGQRVCPKKTQLKKSFQCDRCPEEFRFKSELKKHYAKHTGEKRFFCKHCAKGFTTFRNYSLHITAHKGTKTFSCQQCEKSFSEIVYLKRHMKIHTDRELKHLCEFCSKAFPTRDQLKSHVRRMHMERILTTCPICDIKLKGPLQQHMTIHTGEKPYTCSECGRKFRKYSTYKNHMDAHRGVKRFSCSVCGYKCLRKEALTVHMRTHTGEKPYRCAECDVAFTQSHCLKSHMMKKHQ